jgi:dihydroorotase-like cyclic amidohydrolase
MNREKTIREDEVISKVGFTPWEGYTAKGIPVYTIVRGTIVMEDGKVVGKMGYGEYIPSSHS